MPQLGGNFRLHGKTGGLRASTNAGNAATALVRSVRDVDPDELAQLRHELEKTKKGVLCGGSAAAARPAAARGRVVSQ